MRKVTREVVGAFMRGEKRCISNTMTDGRRLFLFGNRIACKDDDGRLYISTCGWPTVTTRDRLNAIPGVNVYRRKGVLFLNGEEWDGNEIAI